MKYITLTIIASALTSCAHTRHTVYDPATGNKVSTTLLGGDYGIAKTGDEYGGGRTYASNDTATRITISSKGDMVIDGAIDHSTRAAIQSDAAVKITSNVAKLVGWIKMLDTLGDILEPKGDSGGHDSAHAKPKGESGGGDSAPAKPGDGNGGDDSSHAKPADSNGGGVGNGGKPHPVDPNKGPGKGDGGKPHPDNSNGGGVGNGGKPHPVDPNKGPGKGNQRKG
jgi:hypothetical protein